MTTDQKIIKSKLGMLKLAEKLGDVPETCKLFGLKRHCRFRDRYCKGGEAALGEISRKKPGVKNRVDPDAERSRALPSQSISLPLAKCESAMS